jgi:protein transport protein SEC31
MTKHSGAIKALQFNPKHSNLLATGGAKGEVIVSTNLLPMFW